ncbi:MAG: hypothetical protein Q9165_005961 [Trypethelium subeluteriae]
MDENRSKTPQVVLALHIAVDCVYRQGAGIGIVQRAECAATGTIKRQPILDQERKYGFSREDLAVENIKTHARAHIIALVHALGLARGTIKRRSSLATKVQKVAVYSDSLKVVELINHHIKHAPASLANVKSTNDRSMIKRVIIAAQKLSRQGLEVLIAGSSGNGKGWARARILARQKGRQACKSRRQVQRTDINRPSEEQEEIAGGRTLEGTFELAIRSKNVPILRHQEVKQSHHSPTSSLRPQKEQLFWLLLDQNKRYLVVQGGYVTQECLVRRGLRTLT